jgi:putative molybdopterin biosynthesis protein
VTATLAETLHAGGGRRAFQPVALVPRRGGGHTAFALAAESGAITTLAEADGFFQVLENTKRVPEGSTVEVTLFGVALRPADLVITGSHCLGIDYLLDVLGQTQSGFRAKVIAVGSTGGISAVARGEADVAGIHLIHPETGEYNEWALRARHLEGLALLVRGYHRQQVLAIRPGGSRRLASLAGLLDGKHRFVNRNPGSGTRALLDAEIKELARDRGLSFEAATAKIHGWDVEAKSHSAVATAVATGRADAGVCVETAAVRAGLARIPLAVESFDFLVRAERAFSGPVRTFLETLASEAFAKDLSARVPGLTVVPDTGAIVWGQKSPKRERRARR